MEHTAQEKIDLHNEIKQLTADFLAAGGEITQVKETFIPYKPKASDFTIESKPAKRKNKRPDAEFNKYQFNGKTIRTFTNKANREEFVIGDVAKVLVMDSVDIEKFLSFSNTKYRTLYINGYKTDFTLAYLDDLISALAVVVSPSKSTKQQLLTWLVNLDSEVA